MPKRDNASAGRRPPPGASPIGAEPAHSAGATRVVPFTSFSDTQWQAIRAIRDDWPSNIDWDRFRLGLEGQGRLYWRQHESRKRFGTPSSMRKRLTTLLQKIRNVRGDMEGLPEHVRHGTSNLGETEQWIHDQLALYEAIEEPLSSGFSGRSDYYRDMLCEWLLIEWTTTLGGELTYSRELHGQPYGPLIDFLALALGAILGKAPGASGLAKIIDEFR
ncbi:hypothetical protein ACMA5K_22125 [Bradyrhizobium diazoefficiens]|uniref:hypothetical protein n=1 Tax=Bradyrhizobium diazoefficiens TaxID=1355477 RepID=UPI0015B3EAC8|nr:hypothetical protein [Bradyrhizobium diazoefficiens]QLD43483.1 hypothetical protein HUW42_21950 [Bradyrhizobium diazoefficiens]